MIDSNGSEPLKGSVVVEGKKISEVGRKGNNVVSSGAEVLDASGKTVMPGLIEAHTHPLGERSLDPGFRKYFDNLVYLLVLPLLKSVDVLRRLLTYGVTSARILHGAIPSVPEMKGEWLVTLRTAVERDYFPAPRIVAAGCVFHTAGHIYSIVPPSLVRPGWRGADGVWEVRR